MAGLKVNHIIMGTNSDVTYHIVGIFRGMYISRLSMELGFLRLKFLWMKVIQKYLCFSCLATWLCMKNLYYYFKRGRQSSLPNTISQSRQS